MSKPKILVLDIETSPAMSYHWRMFKENISTDQLIDPTRVLMVGMQWYGERHVEVADTWSLGERQMLQVVHDRIMEADAVVTKNGTKFDIPHLRTWFLLHGFPSLPALTHIDLEKVARFNFKFQSNKLEFIVEFLGIGHKMDHEGFMLWRKCMEGDEKARAKMIRYCKRDVIITTKLYHKLRGWIPDHPAMRSLGTEACPTCQSKDTQKRGIRRTKCFHIQRHQCNKCGGWFSGKRTKVA